MMALSSAGARPCFSQAQASQLCSLCAPWQGPPVTQQGASPGRQGALAQQLPPGQKPGGGQERNLPLPKASCGLGQEEGRPFKTKTPRIGK